MKRIVFMIIASLLVLGSVLPGCTGAAGPQIIIGVAGPLGNVQGVHMLNGALLAAQEINAAGGLLPLGATENYTIKIVQRDTDEINNPPNAKTATQYLITNKGAQFIIGGFRTEAVQDVIQNVILQPATQVPYFICGAATYSLLGPYAAWYPYNPTYAGYKYIFRATPFNDIFLVNNIFLMFSMIGKKIQADMGYTWSPAGPPFYATWNHKVRVAVVAESLTWAVSMIASAKAIIGGYGPMFGWKLVSDNATGPGAGDGVWEVSDKESETNLTTYLNQIKDTSAHIIFTILSGPVGVTYGKLKGQLGIPAVSVGINVEGQDPGYWAKTQYGTGQYGAEYEIGMGTWAPNVTQTSATAPFLAAYGAEYGLFPLYTAASYDMVYTLKKAITAVGTNKDAVVGWLENKANAQLTSTGQVGYYPLWNGSTMGWYYSAANPAGSELPALNLTQLESYYLPAWHQTIGVYNFTMPPFTTHDLVYGPRTNDADPLTGWLTGLAVQWKTKTSITGEQVGVWPKAGYDVPMTAASLKLQTTLSRAVCGLNWSNTLEYAGTVAFTIPAAWETTWGGWST